MHSAIASRDCADGFTSPPCRCASRRPSYSSASRRPARSQAACAVYGASAMLLFGNQRAAARRGSWRSAKVTRVLWRPSIITNICPHHRRHVTTPVLFALSPADSPAISRAVIWVTAADRHDTAYRLARQHPELGVHALCMLCSGLAPVTLIPQAMGRLPQWARLRPILIACGGAAYIAGAVCIVRMRNASRCTDSAGWSSSSSRQVVFTYEHRSSGTARATSCSRLYASIRMVMRASVVCCDNRAECSPMDRA